MKMFPDSYHSAKQSFVKKTHALGLKHWQLELDSKGPGEIPLTIDVAWYGNEHPENVILHSSGTHGVEGFAGSEIQLQALSRIGDFIDSKGPTALVFMHCVNPYGMAWLRRVNENNVDLNRNALPQKNYTDQFFNQNYEKILNFLVPESPYSLEGFGNAFGALLQKYDLKELGEIIAGGQYKISKGLFFGGFQAEQSLRLLEEWANENLLPKKSIRRIFHIDVHSGLGEKGETSLFLAGGTKNNEFLANTLGLEITHGSEDESAGIDINEEGILLRGMAHLLAQQTYYGLTQEFGTCSEGEVLLALINENVAHQQGLTNPMENEHKLQLKRVFCPDDESWQESVVLEGLNLLKKVGDCIGHI